MSNINALSLSSIPTLHAEVTIQRVAGELVASTADGIHSFCHADGSESEVATKMVEWVNGERTILDIAELVTNEFEVTEEVAQNDALRFMAILVQKKILTRR
jgi:hypothetical protein